MDSEMAGMVGGVERRGEIVRWRMRVRGGGARGDDGGNTRCGRSWRETHNVAGVEDVGD